ncbi:hypothetical protein KOR42_01890 [Thalassoglobus neptunius]|uniref:Organic solvent tolerance-like N-terminal domain-containing protein n=1 Tax=Thalassoglobus neptunius TaxID=1938619 RepID=A0A5C5X109_9PLAN|nr:hypothetical protein [Thalassoglobus neptunius]TWT56834.1 hypothetical protein KOR42_01890 [Thalassoglobus neptunius]
MLRTTLIMLLLGSASFALARMNSQPEVLHFPETESTCQRAEPAVSEVPDEDVFRLLSDVKQPEERVISQVFSVNPLQPEKEEDAPEFPPFESEPNLDAPQLEFDSIPQGATEAESLPAIPETAASPAEDSTDEAELPVCVILNAPAGLSPRETVKTEMVSSPRKRSVEETYMEGGVARTVKRHVIEMVQKPVEKIVDGAAMIRCESFRSDVRSNDDGEQIVELEIDGELIFKNSTFTIHADSASLKDGKFVFRNANIQSQDSKMQATELTVDFTAHRVQIGDLPAASPNNGLMPDPTPVPSYEPARGRVPSPLNSSLPDLTPVNSKPGDFQPRF